MQKKIVGYLTFNVFCSTMKPMLRKFKIFIAYLLLGSYASFVVTVCICMPTRDMDFSLQASVQVATDNQADHHNHSHEHSEQNDSKTENCCKDIRLLCLSNTPKQLSETLQFGYTLHPAIVKHEHEHEIIRSGADLALRGLDTRGSPPKNQNIRIYIQSFLI